MNSIKAKQIHLKDLLDQLGYKPKYEDKGEHWYLSPFRQETKASFKITRDGKGWYDHGAGEGGNIVDFVISYPDRPFENARDIPGALRALRDLYGQARHPSKQDSTQEVPTISAARRQDTVLSMPEPKPEPALQITKVQPLQKRALIRYLAQRRIDAETAERYLQEVYYQWQEKPYFALVFTNVSGGYELRNPYFQGSYATKDITLLNVSKGGEPFCRCGFRGIHGFSVGAGACRSAATGTAGHCSQLGFHAPSRAGRASATGIPNHPPLF